MAKLQQKMLAILLTLILAIGASSCASGDEGDTPAQEDDGIEYTPIDEEYAPTPITEQPAEDLPPPEDTVPAVHTVLTVYINDAQIPMTAYYIEGAYYFYLRDVAYVLKDTLAGFGLHLAGPESPIIRGYPRGVVIVDYGPPSSVYLSRNQPFEPRGIEMRPRVPGIEAAVHRRFRIHDQTWLSRGSFYNGVYIDAFIINDKPYVSFWDMDQIIGFDTYWDAQNNTFYIDTREPALSEYGRRVAEEFLQPFLTLRSERDLLALREFFYLETGEEIELGLPFYQDGIFVQQYRMFDLTGEGIPAIVLHWDIIDLSRWGAGQFLYVYQDSGFVQVAEIGMHVFYRSGQGEIFLYTDKCLGYMGLGATLHSVVLGDGDPRLELLLSTGWDNELRENVFYASEELAGMDEEAHRLFWRHAPIFSVPGHPDEPLFTIRPFTFAHLDD